MSAWPIDTLERSGATQTVNLPDEDLGEEVSGRMCSGFVHGSFSTSETANGSRDLETGHIK